MDNELSPCVSLVTMFEKLPLSRKKLEKLLSILSVRILQFLDENNSDLDGTVVTFAKRHLARLRNSRCKTHGKGERGERALVEREIVSVEFRHKVHLRSRTTGSLVSRNDTRNGTEVKKKASACPRESASGAYVSDYG